MLIAFSVYLHECRQKGRSLTFEDWLLARTDITSSIDGIHLNPAGALAPVPVAPDLIPQYSSNDYTEEPSSDHHVSISEARRILLRRRGHTIGKRTILKSYTLQKNTDGTNVPKDLLVKGISDMRKVNQQSIFTFGNATISGLRQFMKKIGALSGGHARVVFTDLREELVLYVNGTAYMRRELEMPAAALHHAGIKAVKIEDLERRLRTDMINESIAWGGKVLLHREDEKAAPLARLSFESENRTFNLAKFNSFGNQMQRDDRGEDITKTTAYQPTTFVSAFWETTGEGGDIDSVC